MSRDPLETEKSSNPMGADPKLSLIAHFLFYYVSFAYHLGSRTNFIAEVCASHHCLASFHTFNLYPSSVCCRTCLGDLASCLVSLFQRQRTQINVSDFKKKKGSSQEARRKGRRLSEERWAGWIAHGQSVLMEGEY